MRALLFALLISVQALGAPSSTDRLKDAIQVQRGAIQLLLELQKSSEQNSKNPSLLLKVIESEEKLSKIQFELANSRPETRQDPDLKAYHATLESVVHYCTLYLKQFQDTEAFQHVLLIRGKTYQSLEQNNLAVSDYENLAFHTIANHVSKVGGMALIDLRFEMGQYEQTVLTVDKLNMTSSDTEFADALGKKASALIKMKQYPLAMNTIQSAIRETVRRENHSSLKESLNVFSELVATLSGLQPQAQILEDYVPFLKSTLPHDWPENPFDSLTVQFITRNLNANLATLENYARDILSPKQLEEGLAKYRMSRLEHDLDQRLYPDALITLNLLSKQTQEHRLPEKSGQKLYTVLSGTSEALRRISNKSDLIDQCLVAEYQLALLLPTHPAEDNFTLYYNLAEVLFGAKNYAAASTYYQKAREFKADPKILDQVTFKLISSRYRELLAKNEFPSELTPISIHGKGLKNEKPDPLFTDWLMWIDEAKKHPFDTDSVLKFEFEACRTLYVKYGTMAGLERMEKMLFDFPDRKIISSVALLFFDTHVQSKDWDEIIDTSTKILNQLTAQKKSAPTLETELKTYRDNASAAAITEYFLAKNQDSVIKRGETHLRNLPQSPHKNQILIQMGVSSLQLGKKDEARTYFSKADLSGATLETRKLALSNELELDVQNFHFEKAATAYQALAELDPSSENAAEFGRSALYLAWISENESLLKKVLDALCKGKKHAPSECDTYSLWLNPGEEKVGKSLDAFATALAALPQIKSVPVEFSSVAPLWPKLDLVQRTAYISRLTSALNTGLESYRHRIVSLSPIRLDPAMIEKRGKYIARLEQLQDLFKIVQWSELESPYFKSLADVYADFEAHVLKLHSPQGASSKEKSDFRAMIEQNATSLQEKSDHFLKENQNLNLKDFNGFTPAIALQWIDFGHAKTEFKEALTDALKHNHTLATAFLLQYAQKEKLLPASSESVLTAALLAMSGGATESEALFEEIHEKRALPLFKPLMEAGPRSPASANQKSKRNTGANP